MAYQIIQLSKNARDHTGETFGRLVAIAPVARSKHGAIMWLCICKCGSDTVCLQRNLACKTTLSCGCLSIENLKKRATVHGMSSHPLYQTWADMKERCYNTNNAAYHNYGGRGIKVSDRWLNSFPNFLADMGEKPSPEYTLERIDNNSGYCKTNCCWATRLEQNDNTRISKHITYAGEKLNQTQWSLRLGGSTSLVSSRLKNGWSEERAVTEPVRINSHCR